MFASFFILLLAIQKWGRVGGQSSKPNFIIMQPDDLQYFEEWLPPPHFPNNDRTFSFDSFELPNINRIRNQGLQMTQAYTDISAVEGGNDCSENNLAAVLSANGYRTGVAGKWHLDNTRNGYDYDSYTAGIRNCGFDFAEAIYAENLDNQGFNSDGDFSHNLEYMADRAVSFIKEDTSQPFFLYVNPTAPHGSGNVLEALQNFTCLDTPEGRLDSEPVVPGMTAEYGSCEEYRQSIIDRAGNSVTQETLGAIWVDDTVGAIFRALEDSDRLENTFFLFQMDHGQEGKGTLWEPGLRISQFIHFPSTLGNRGEMWDGIVSTIDIGPTILDFAGVGTNSSGYYEMDGTSWRSAITSSESLTFWRDERCLAFEVEIDRAIRCGCDKYMSLDIEGTTHSRARRSGTIRDTEILLNLCGVSQTAATAPETSPEAPRFSISDPVRLSQLRAINKFHVDRTAASFSPLDFSPLQDTVPLINMPSDSPSGGPTSVFTGAPVHIQTPMSDTVLLSPIVQLSSGADSGSARRPHGFTVLPVVLSSIALAICSFI